MTVVLSLGAIVYTITAPAFPYDQPGAPIINMLVDAKAASAKPKFRNEAELVAVKVFIKLQEDAADALEKTYTAPSRNNEQI